MLIDIIYIFISLCLLVYEYDDHSSPNISNILSLVLNISG